MSKTKEEFIFVELLVTGLASAIAEEITISQRSSAGKASRG
jgi:hypothetical protein